MRFRSSNSFPLLALGLFACLALILTRPLAGQLFKLALGDDALLNVWIMEWGKFSLLGGPQALLSLPDGNILYPYRYTFLFSEHLLPTTALLLPGLLLLPGPLAALNLYTLLTFVLTGFGVWLLVAYWTGSRWAGLPAGVAVAFAPARLSVMDQPNIMTIQWMPLAALSLHRWLDRGERRDWWLALLFVNLQTLSATNYLAHLILLLALLFLACVLVYRRTITRRQILATLGLALATAILNAPVWWAYLRMSAALGVERDQGAVYLGSAHLLNYFMATPDNLLYGALVPRLTALAGASFGHAAAFPLFPGLTVLALGLAAFAMAIRRYAAGRFLTPLSQGMQSLKPNGTGVQRRRVAILTLLAWLVAGFVMSLGINDQALGPRLAPALRLLLPYHWLYAYLPGFRGFRVPARFAVLVLLALGGLAAFGTLALHARLARVRSGLLPVLSLALVGLMAVEFLTPPLTGERYPYGADAPPIYGWLASETDPQAVVVELPYDDWSATYYAGLHRRRLVNGASGFHPPPLREAADLLDRFPSWAAIEWLQRLPDPDGAGVDYVLLHPAQYDAAYGPGASDRRWGEMSAYLDSILSVRQVGDDLALRLAPARCPAQPAAIAVAMTVDAGDTEEVGGAEPRARLTFSNPTAAGYAFDPNLPSFVQVPGCRRPWRAAPGVCRFAFHEPFMLLPGQTAQVPVPLGHVPLADSAQVTAQLANLGRTLAAGPGPATERDVPPNVERAPGLIAEFEGGARLLGYRLSSPETAPCDTLEVLLDWQAPIGTGGRERVSAQLVDRYGWPVIEAEQRPWRSALPGGRIASRHRLPIPGPLPAGQYTLAVRLTQADGAPLPADTAGGPAERLPLASVVVRPPPPDLEEGGWQPAGDRLADTATLLAYRLDRDRLAPGDWLRLTLVWRADRAPERDATVFTQLIGPDGQVWGQHDNPPRGGWYPTSLWQSGELVADDYLLQLKPGAPSGRYTLATGMYLPDTLQRLPVQPATGSLAADMIVLGEIEVED